MKVYPKITGALCANTHPGSYTGQDAFNNMIPVIERNGNGNAMCRKRAVESNDNAAHNEHVRLYARSANIGRGGY